MAMGNEIMRRDVLVLAYKAFEGDMRGKTLLQKRVYFLSVMLGIDMPPPPGPPPPQAL